MEWSWVEDAITAAQAGLASSAFTWKFENNGPLVEVTAAGQAAGHHFTATSGPIPVRSADDQNLQNAVGEVEARMWATADRFHRATPWPSFLKSQREAMTNRELVDEALNQYKGQSLQALSLPPEEWLGFLAETGLLPDEFGNVTWRDVQLKVSASGLRYIIR